MYLTEMEIFSQQEALEKTFDYIMGERDSLEKYFAPPSCRYVFFGCGSSYMLAKSAAKMFSVKPGVDAYALAGGDYLLNPELYRPLVENSVVVFLSRSGATSEMLIAAKELASVEGVTSLVITMKEGSELESLSDCALKLPWAFDKSVCQTRTVTNFYLALLLLCAMYDCDDAQINDVSKAISQTSKLLDAIRPAVRELVVSKNFTDVVVLADGVLCGIAEEASLAFTEICMVSGKYFNLLDYRHGPKVLNGAATLTILTMQPLSEDKTKLQGDLLSDIRACGGTTVAIRPLGTGFEADLAVDCDFDCFPTYGVALICVAQVIAYEKAVANGVNPDQPAGLSAWISL